MAGRPNSFDDLLEERHEFPTPSEETPVEGRTRQPFEKDDELVGEQNDQGAEKTAVDRPVIDDKESSEQPKEPEEEDDSVTVERRQEDKNEEVPRDEPKTKKRAANPDHGSKSEKRRSLSAPDEVPNAEDHNSGQLDLSSSMVSEEESGNDKQH